MKQLEELIVPLITEVFKKEFDNELNSDLIQLQKTRKDFEGDITLVVFPLLRLTKKSPEETAKIIGECLKGISELVVGYNVVKGFLNLIIQDSYWKNFLLEIQKVSNYGFKSKNSTGKVMVEFSSPNTNKPLHLGHLRNNFLGDSIARIFEANGKEVIRTQIINDRGIHICKSMLAWLSFGDGETPESTGLKGDKLVGNYYVKFDQEYKKEIQMLMEQGKTEEEAVKNAPLILEAQEMLRKWEAGDEEIRNLWKQMNNWVYDGFDQTYNLMEVSFDKLYYESDTYSIGKDKVLLHEKSDSFYRKEDNSIWIDLSKEKLDAKLLLRSDGTSVYMTQDIGTAIIREEEFHCNHYYYVVGNEQDYHFKVLAVILQKMDFSWAKNLEHLSYGMVDLPSGKMKSREGTVVDADDLILEMRETAAEISESHGKLDQLGEDETQSLNSMIGLGALKYYILKVDPKKRILFDPKESVDFNGNTGPFIQYTHARIKSILRRVEPNNSDELSLNEFDLSAEDRELIKWIKDYPAIIEEAGENKSPALIANYTYDFVKSFNHFYQNVPPIIKETNESLKSFRLAMCEVSADIIARSMQLLGIGVPERM